MKPILFLLSLIPSLATAQDCTEYITKTVDKFTKEVTYALHDPLVISNTSDWFGIGISYNQNTKYLVIAAPTLSCVNEHSKMVVLFDDDTTLELYNILGFNCAGGMMVSIQSAKNIYLKRVKAIRLSAIADTIDVDLDDDQSALLLTSLQCFDQTIKAR